MLIDAEKSFAPKVMAAWRVAAAKESYLRRNPCLHEFLFWICKSKNSSN